MIRRDPGDLHTTITHQIARRFFLRWHMATILACVLLSGVVCSALLLRLGLRSMHWRYVLAVLGSYALFFALIRLWLLYVSIVEGRQQSFGSMSALDDVGDAGNLGGGFSGWSGSSGARLHPGGGSFGGAGASGSFDAPPSGGSGGSGEKSWSSGSGSGWGLDLDDDWLVLVAFVLLLLAVSGTGAYLVYQAPHILGETAFQVALATSLHKAAKRVVGFGWTGSVLRSTWIAFLIVLVMAGLFGWIAQRHCPTATKLSEVLFGCLLEP